MADKVKVIQIDTGSAQKSVKDLRNELKSLRNTLLNVDQGTVEYARVLQQAANIQKELREQTQMLNASAMDFGQIIGNVTTTVGGMMSGMQAAIAVMNLFGIQNKEIMESLKQMQNIMALTQGIAGIENGIKSLGRLVNALKASTTAARLFSAALTPKGLLAIAAAIGAITAAVAALMRYFGRGGNLSLSISSTGEVTNNNPSNTTKYMSLKQIDESIQNLVGDTIVGGVRMSIDEFTKDLKRQGYTDKQILEEKLKILRKQRDDLYNELSDTYKNADEELLLIAKEWNNAVEKYTDMHPLEYYSLLGINTIGGLIGGGGINYGTSGSLEKGKDTKYLFSETYKDYQDELYNNLKDYFTSINDTVLLAQLDSMYKTGGLTYQNWLTERGYVPEANKKSSINYAELNWNSFMQVYNSSQSQNFRNINDALIESVKHYIELEERGENIVEQNEQIKEQEQSKEEAARKYKENLESARKSYSSLLKEIETFGLSEEELDILGVNRLFGNKDSGFTEDGQYVSTLREARRYRIISEEELTKQLELLEEEREKRIAEIRKKYREAEEEDRETSLQSALDQIQLEIDKKIANINHEYELYNQAVYQDQLEIEEEIASGFFKTTNDMQKQLNDLDEEMIQYNIERLEKMLEIEHLSEYERIQIQNDIYDNQIRLYELQDQHHAAMVQREVARYSTLGYSVGEIFSNLGTLMEEGSEEAKAFQIMGATINMLAGITAAISGAFTTHSGIWDVAIAAAQAAAIASSGAATIAQIARTTKDNASSVGMSAASTALTLVAPVQYTQDVQGAELERQIAQQKVYVLESDITTSQKKVSVVESEAKF